LLVSLLLLACASKEPAEAPAAEAAPVAEAAVEAAPTEVPAAAPAGEGQEVVLSGTVIKKPWSKTVESWNAGGSDYYVLDVGSAAIPVRSAAEGVILRPSATVTMEQMAAAEGKKVEVRGRYVAAEPPKVEPMGQYPVGPDGAPLPSGGGFEVTSLTLVP
jgi:hypothetical protein